MNIKAYHLFLLLIVATALPVIVNGQPPNSAQNNQREDTQLLHELLDEVRQLRLLMQQSNLYSLRSQIALEGIRRQEEHIDRAERQLGEHQNELNGIKLSRSRLTEQQKSLEEQIKLGSESEGRESQQQAELRELRQGFEELLQREEFLNAQKDKITSQIQIEQKKLDKLNGDLAEIIKSLQQLTANGTNKAEKKSANH